MTKPYDDSGVPPLAPGPGLEQLSRSGHRRAADAHQHPQRSAGDLGPPHLAGGAWRASPTIPDDAADVIVGDPNAVTAALTSGAFPVAFVPRSLDEIYPPGTPRKRCPARHPGRSRTRRRPSDSPRSSKPCWPAAYPLADDLYLDGGAIDNHPLSTAIVAIKDTARRARSARAGRPDLSRQTHDVFVIFLGPKPEIVELAPGEVQGMLAYEYGLRA